MTHVHVEHCPICGKWTKSSISMATGTGCECKTLTKGQGYIRISASIWPELGSPQTPEAWHKALLLPETYTVESIDLPEGGFALVRGEVFTLTVLGVPSLEESAEVPEVTPVYAKDADSKVFLTRIDIRRAS